jgi:hypothetical protein
MLDWLLIGRMVFVDMPIDVPLIRVGDRSLVSACLMKLEPKHLNDFSNFWWERLQTQEDEDQYWDWVQKERIYLMGTLSSIYEGYAIECEQMTQGMMLLQTGGYRSQVEPDRRLVYVHSLATAPWNRMTNPEPNGFRTVGGTLLEFARSRSETLGFNGLVGLHSLPRAEGFYRKMGMRDSGFDSNKDGLRYFEWYSPKTDWWDEYRLD